ncbi:hypothetical protein ACWGJP_10780 [Microbacterium sp. NPDC055903]
MSRTQGCRIALTAAMMLALAGCAAASPGSPAPVSSDAPPEQGLGSLLPAPPDGEVRATGTVMDTAGDVELCLGAVAESYPPQCSGIPVAGWSWEGVDGSEQSGEVRWGAYAVTGTYDGDTFTSTQAPVLLALYDPMPLPDPTGGEQGETDESRASEIVDEVAARLADDDVLLGAYPDRGYVWVDVVWDDGTLQDAADADFGERVVIVRSALVPLD